MLQTFTKNDKLREQYRLHEEFLRVQRTEKALAKKLKQDYMSILKAHKKEKQAKEAALQAKADLTKKSVVFMKKHGTSPEEISQILNIPLEQVESFLK